MTSENQEPVKGTNATAPNAATKRGTPDATPAPSPRTSPGQWLLIIGLVAGFLVTFFLWERTAAPPVRDDFKPEVIIIQLNDTYRVDAVGNGKLGGLGRVATLIQRTLDQGHHVLVVHAGDFIAPSLESKVFHGKQMIDALNYLDRLAPLYVVPGNHEFDEDDPGMVINAIERSNFEWLGSNVKVNPGNRSMSRKIIDNRIIPAGHLKLGVFALTLHGDHYGGRDQTYAPVEFEEKYLINDVALEAMANELPRDTLKKVAGLRDQAFQGKENIQRALSQVTGIQGTEALSSLADYASLGYAGIAERQIQELENAGADVVIGLTHLNIGDDRQLSQLRRAHPKFMWIAGGHEHYAQRERLSVDSALITKGDSNARSVWRVAIGFARGVPDIREEKIDLSDEYFKPEEGYQRDIADNYRSALREKFSYLDQVIGNTHSLGADCLDGDEETVRSAPSNWGTFIADQMRVTNGQGKMQIGLLNGGGIRIDDRPCGSLSFEHLERTFGFETQVYYIKLTGEDLKQQILENAVAGKQGAGRFLQLAGIKFEFDRHRLSGDRVFDIKVQKGSSWSEFHKNETYSVAVPKFLYDCNDGYRFREKVKFLLPAGPDVRTIVYNALKAARAKARTDTSVLDLKVGATELPEYAKTTIPKISSWKAPPDNICPKQEF